MATKTESTGTKSALQAHELVALFVAGSMSFGARGGAPATFGFPGEHEEDGPNWFLIQLEHEHAYPEAPSHPYVRTTAREKAHRAFEDARKNDDRRGRFGTWRNLGPSTVLNPVDPMFPDAPLAKNVSGRATALAIGRTCREGKCRLWVGTAGGGLWRTDHAMDDSDVDWEHITLPEANNTIGSLALDPNDAGDDTLLVGTGESNFTYTSGASSGVYRTTNGGKTWVRLPTLISDPAVSPNPIDFTATRGVGRVVVKPGDSKVIYVGTTYALRGMTAVRGGQTVLTGSPQARVGLYRSIDGGNTWTLEWIPPVKSPFVSAPGFAPGTSEVMEGVKDIQFDPVDPGTLYVTAFNNAIHRSSPRLEGDGAFRPVFVLTGYDGLTALAEFALTVKNGHTRIYAGNGVDDAGRQGLFRLDNADVPAATLVDPSVTPLANSAAWQALTSGLSDLSKPGVTSFAYCNAQCFYDQVLAVPNGRPDTLLVGAQVNFWTRGGTIRSTDAGVSFKDISYDLQSPTGAQHVDVHAIAFHPANPDIVFVASDGGVSRTSGAFGNGSNLCETAIGFTPGTPEDQVCRGMMSNLPTRIAFLNEGLQTIQLFNVAADPNAPFDRLMGGAQDNGTLLFDKAVNHGKQWSVDFGIGDGTSANGFHPANPAILFASFQSKFFFTNFQRGTGGSGGWVWTSGPILFAPGERASGSQLFTGRQFMTFDPVYPDTQFTGYSHVWRTPDNGGNQEFLENNCTVFDVFFLGNFTPACGDWTPLGPRLNDTVSGFGTDRSGGLVVAVQRTPADAGTLWAATNVGRVFVSHNANDASPASVTFARIDSTNAAAPGRFISGIAVDPTNPNHAWIAYSGFSALTPTTPGHVFEVTWNPSTSTSEWTSLDADLGDLPINHLVRDPDTGDLFAATDFGVLVLPGGEQHWREAGKGLPTVLTPYLQIHPDSRLLFAGTHGLGAWFLTLR